MTQRYRIGGWYNGQEDCDPPEPNTEWLAIEEEGEEIAVVILRTNTELDPEWCRERKVKDAVLIVNALNAYQEETANEAS